MSASFSFGTTKIERTDRQKREEFLELDGDVKVEEKKEGEKEGEGKAVPSDQMMDQMLKNDWMKIFPHTFSSIEVIICSIFDFNFLFSDSPPFPSIPPLP